MLLTARITALPVLLSIVLTTLMIAPPAPAEVVDGLVLHLPCDGDATDHSGHGYDGVVRGPVLTEDRCGHSDCAYAFDGIDDYIRFEEREALALTSWTIAIWVYLPAGANTRCAIVRKGPDDDRYNYELGLDEPQVVKVAYETCDSEFDHELYGGVPDLDGWYHLVATRDDATGLSMLYRDGEWVASAQWDDTACANDGVLKLGAPFSVDEGYFQGVIDDVRIYDRALTEPEIQELYTEPAPVADTTWSAVKKLYAR